MAENKDKEAPKGAPEAPNASNAPETQQPEAVKAAEVAKETAKEAGLVPTGTVVNPAARSSGEAFAKDPRAGERGKEATPRTRRQRAQRDLLGEYREAYRVLAEKDPTLAAKYPNPDRPGQNIDLETVLESIRGHQDGLQGVGDEDLKS